MSGAAAQSVFPDTVAARGRPIARPAEAPRFHWSVAAHDPWWGYDKAQHAVASLLLTTSAQYVLTQKLGVSERRALPVSAALAAQAGLAKETWDAYRPRGSGFSRRDLVWDAVGIGAAVLLVRW